MDKRSSFTRAALPCAIMAAVLPWIALLPLIRHAAFSRAFLAALMIAGLCGAAAAALTINRARNKSGGAQQPAQQEEGR